jgi:hypothetical protein
MGLGIAKVHQQSIPQELSYVSIIALDNFSTNPLICTHHFPVVFRIESAGESSGVHEITEHDGELAALRLSHSGATW